MPKLGGGGTRGGVGVGSGANRNFNMGLGGAAAGLAAFLMQQKNNISNMSLPDININLPNILGNPAKRREPNILTTPTTGPRGPNILSFPMAPPSDLGILSTPAEQFMPSNILTTPAEPQKGPNIMQMRITPEKLKAAGLPQNPTPKDFQKALADLRKRRILGGSNDGKGRNTANYINRNAEKRIFARDNNIPDTKVDVHGKQRSLRDLNWSKMGTKGITEERIRQRESGEFVALKQRDLELALDKLISDLTDENGNWVEGGLETLLNTNWHWGHAVEIKQGGAHTPDNWLGWIKESVNVGRAR
jgi:hypothetical protein